MITFVVQFLASASIYATAIIILKSCGVTNTNAWFLAGMAACAVSTGIREAFDAERR